MATKNTKTTKTVKNADARWDSMGIKVTSRPKKTAKTSRKKGK